MNIDSLIKNIKTKIVNSNKELFFSECSDMKTLTFKIQDKYLYIRTLNLKIQSNKELDFVNKTRGLIFEVMKICTENSFSIESVELEDKEIFSAINGFDKEFKI